MTASKLDRFFLGAVFMMSSVGSVSAQHQRGVQAPAELRELIGDWEMTSIAPLGSTGDARTVRFRPDGTYTTFGEAGGELWSGTFSMDPLASPKIWDHRTFGMRDADPSSDILGIYEVRGDSIVVSVTRGRWDGERWEGHPRATTFEAADGYMIILFRRLDPERERGSAYSGEVGNVIYEELAEGVEGDGGEMNVQDIQHPTSNVHLSCQRPLGIGCSMLDIERSARATL